MRMKGQMVMGTLVKIVLALAGLVLIGSLITSFYFKLGDKPIEAVCRESVDFRSMTATSIKFHKATLAEDVKISPLVCQTIDKKLSGTKDEIKKELADLMARCWWQFRLGKTEDLFKNIPGVDNDNKGFVCYTALIEEIKTDDENKKDDKIPYEELIGLMSKKNSYPKMTKGDRSYLDYIQWGGGPGRMMLYLEDGAIQEGYGYEIAFIEKGSDMNSWFGNALLIGGGGAALVGAVVIWPAIGAAGTAKGVVATATALKWVVIGSGVAATGATAAAGGIHIKMENLLSQKDVATIMLLDLSDTKKREKFHDNVFIGDIEGK